MVCAGYSIIFWRGISLAGRALLEIMPAHKLIVGSNYQDKSSLME
jgi:hypothetical protein